MPKWKRPGCLSYRDDDGKFVFWPVNLTGEKGGNYDFTPFTIKKDRVYTKKRGPEGNGDFGTYDNEEKAFKGFKLWVKERSMGKKPKKGEVHIVEIDGYKTEVVVK